MPDSQPSASNARLGMRGAMRRLAIDSTLSATTEAAASPMPSAGAWLPP
jgi:hypothetical protein